MIGDLTQAWVYLSASPLLWLTATLAAYLAARWFFDRTGQQAWANPVAGSIIILIGLLALSGTDYPTYFDGAQFVHFLLGPATVALAVPLWRYRAEVRRHALPLACALAAGAVTAAATAIATAMLLGADRQTMLSLAPKSVTAPIAMGIAEQIGGLPSLTATLVIATGILGAMIGPWLLRITGVRSAQAQGTALGTASHGIGTAAAFQLHPLAGTFSGIAMALNGFLTAVIVPLLVRLIG